MKATLTRPVLYSDVDREFRVTLPALLKLFQDVAALHSEQIGFGIRALGEQGIIWVLAKLGIEVLRYPRYGETLRITSWSRGSDGYKMLRDFVIHAGDEKVAAGASVWFVLDLGSRRVRRVPPEIDAAYQAEDERASATLDLDSLAAYGRLDAADARQVQLRASDQDASGHVNNTTYCAFALDALQAALGPLPPVAQLKLQFSREIPGNAAATEVGFALDGALVRFRIGPADASHARGELCFVSPPGVPRSAPSSA